MADPLLCHPILRSINGGHCPICNPTGTGRPPKQIVPFEDLTARTAAIESGDWRTHAQSILAPIIAGLPSEDAPKGFTKSTVFYKGPPVGMRPTVLYVANEAQRQLSHTEVEAERCRRSLAYFVRAYWPVYAPGIRLLWNWHLDAICNHVQGLLEEWIKRQKDPDYAMKAQNMAINCPPRSLKSTIVSVCAPAWMWLKWPSWKAIFVSANPKVAVRDARACRACLESSWYQEIKGAIANQWEAHTPEHVALSWELVGAGDLQYENTSLGVRMAMSFKSMVTGLGADAIFVDDPNDVKKVMSEKERATVQDIWDLALCNRVQSYTDSIRILIMQRCHEMDLTGHWQATMPASHTVYLAIPLEFDLELDETNRKSPFGFADVRAKEGDNLHVARFTSEIVEQERKRLGPYGFAGQMNQKPVPIEGGAFKRTAWNWCYLASPNRDFHPLVGTILESSWVPVDHGRIGPRPKGCDNKRPSVPIPFLDQLVITVDATFGSEKETASRVGLIVAGLKGADRFALDDRTHQMNLPDTIEAIRQLVKDFPAVNVVLIERKANGQGIVDVLKHEISGIIPIDDNENWMVRANAMLPSVLSGNWYILEGAQWAAAFVNEFAMFPNGAHDDRIDSCSQLAKYFFGSGNGGTLNVPW